MSARPTCSWTLRPIATHLSRCFRTQLERPTPLRRSASSSMPGCQVSPLETSISSCASLHVCSRSTRSRRTWCSVAGAGQSMSKAAGCSGGFGSTPARRTRPRRKLDPRGAAAADPLLPVEARTARLLLVCPRQPRRAQAATPTLPRRRCRSRRAARPQSPPSSGLRAQRRCD